MPVAAARARRKVARQRASESEEDDESASSSSSSRSSGSQSGSGSSSSTSESSDEGPEPPPSKGEAAARLKSTTPSVQPGGSKHGSAKGSFFGNWRRRKQQAAPVVSAAPAAPAAEKALDPAASGASGASGSGGATDESESDGEGLVEAAAAAAGEAKKTKAPAPHVAPPTSPPVVLCCGCCRRKQQPPPAKPLPKAPAKGGGGLLCCRRRPTTDGAPAAPKPPEPEPSSESSEESESESKEDAAAREAALLAAVREESPALADALAALHVGSRWEGYVTMSGFPSHLSASVSKRDADLRLTFIHTAFGFTARTHATLAVDDPEEGPVTVEYAAGNLLGLISARLSLPAEGAEGPRARPALLGRTRVPAAAPAADAGMAAGPPPRSALGGVSLYPSGSKDTVRITDGTFSIRRIY